MPTADELIGPRVVAGLVEAIGRAVPDAPLASLRNCRRTIGPLSLRERSDLLRDALLQDLPGDYAALERVVRTALHDDDFTGWMIWPVTEAVVARALQDRHPDSFDAALALLADLTPRLTAEFAIRSLLQADLDRALPVILSWTDHPDEHVRRLASEGTRPFLPWSKRVHAILSRPEVTRPILDALYCDDSEFVRRSVANHLNDLGRQQPELAVAIATGWMADSDDNTAWVVRHGLRTLVKKANPDALALLGFPPASHVTVRGPVLGNTTVRVGDYLPFEVTLVNTGPEPAPIAVDYIVHHLKANGTQTPKVFKLTTKTLRPGETLTLSRRHSFKPISTRVYREGRHAIEVQVNGTTSGRTVFDLVTGPG